MTDMTDLIPIALPAAVATFTWYFNERRKRATEQYQAKEKKYAALVGALEGFYASTDRDVARQMKSTFLVELSRCWLYCPDDVIRHAYAFLKTVRAGELATDE